MSCASLCRVLTHHNNQSMNQYNKHYVNVIVSHHQRMHCAGLKRSDPCAVVRLIHASGWSDHHNWRFHRVPKTSESGPDDSLAIHTSVGREVETVEIAQLTLPRLIPPASFIQLRTVPSAEVVVVGHESLTILTFQRITYTVHTIVYNEICCCVITSAKEVVFSWRLSVQWLPKTSESGPVVMNRWPYQLVCLFVCLTVSNFTQKQLTGSSWKFH